MHYFSYYFKFTQIFSSTYIHLLFFTQSTYIHYKNTLSYYFGPPPESQTLNCLKIDNIAERQQFFFEAISKLKMKYCAG